MNNKTFNILKSRFFYLLDHTLILLIVLHLISVLGTTTINIFQHILDFTLSDNYNNLSNIVLSMSSNGGSNSNSTNTTIVYNDGTWSDTLRTLFIYGTGALRYTASRTGPGRAFVIGSSVAGDFSTKVVSRIINNPNYLKDQMSNFSVARTSENSASVSLDNRTMETIQANANSASDSKGCILQFADDNPEGISKALFNGMVELLSPILKPVQVTYSNELLASQIYGLGLVMFILCLIIIFLFIVLIINAIVLIYREKILNFFTNKYIRMYLNLNNKILGIEFFILSTTLLYFLYSLSNGLYFIATHPITFT